MKILKLGCGLPQLKLFKTEVGFISNPYLFGRQNEMVNQHNKSRVFLHGF
jgi:hypothetical protein